MPILDPSRRGTCLHIFTDFPLYKLEANTKQCMRSGALIWDHFFPDKLCALFSGPEPKFLSELALRK